MISPFEAESGVNALAKAIKSEVPQILDNLAEKPTENQWTDAIRVGNPKAGVKPLVLMRDWLTRELDNRRLEVCHGLQLLCWWMLMI